MELQAKICDAFLEKFQLKPDEVKALRVQKDGVITEVSTYWLIMYWLIFSS